MIWLESQIKIVNRAESAHSNPRQGDIKWCWLIKHVSSIMRELIRNEYLREANEKCDPSAFSGDGIVDSSLGAPCGDISVSFFECEIGQKEPNRESVDVDPVFRRDPKCVDHEEPAKEIYDDNHPDGNHSSEMSMAAPDFPFSEILSTFST